MLLLILRFPEMPPISFPVKLWNIINTCPYELMRWSNDGTQVLVNEQRFDDLIKLYPSFLRQPSLCGLHRLFAVYEFRSEYQDYEKTGWMRYSHPYFVRGQPDLLEMFVLNHQTRRYNARKVKTDMNECIKRPKKVGRYSPEQFIMCEFVAETDGKDDLQPICSSSLFQFPLDVGLDVDSNPDEQPLPHCLEVDEFSSADCTIIETEPADIDENYSSSFGGQEVVYSNSETWMSAMNENEEWFGLNDRPFAVPVPGDFTGHDVADHTAPTYITLLQMQHYCDTN